MILVADLLLAYDSMVSWIGEALNKFTGHWFTQILLFLFVLGFIVDLIIVFRGGH